MSLRKKALFAAAAALLVVFVLAARYGPTPSDPPRPCGCVFPGFTAQGA